MNMKARAVTAAVPTTMQEGVMRYSPRTKGWGTTTKGILTVRLQNNSHIHRMNNTRSKAAKRGEEKLDFSQRENGTPR